MKTNKWLVLGTSLMLAATMMACQAPDPNPNSSNSNQPESSASTDVDLPDGVALANGIYSYSDESYDKKAEITAKLESYALWNHLAGIPLYDDAGLVQYSKRLSLPTQKYITNYGFGTGEGTITGTQMYNGEINETVDEWKSYFHSWTSTDAGTFNAWNSEGSDVSDRASMTTSSYYSVEMNSTKDGFDWYCSLAKEQPIMIDGLEGQAITGSNRPKSSRFWRVKLKLNDDKGNPITYATASSDYAAFNGRALALEDYMTPFKMMLNYNLKRATDIGTEASGFVGVYDYIQGAHTDEAWKRSVGIRLNTAEQAIDFEFNTPKNDYYAMYNLASSLFSPVPMDFIKAIGGGSVDAGIKTWGVIGNSTNAKLNINNVLSIGAYVPVSWEKGKQIVYKTNSSYFEADRYHYDGMTEVVLADSSAAYKAFLNNELDYVEIPSDYIEAHKTDDNVLTTLGSTTIKINLNSCTQEEWEYYFGTEGTVYPHAKSGYWNVKPIMSNDDFLDGLYFCINRAELARISGRNVALGFLSNGYMSDPEQSIAYRDTEYGKAVIEDYTMGIQDGYSESMASQLFVKAAQDLLAEGKYHSGDIIKLSYLFRYQDTIDKLGKYLKNYIQGTFNAAMAANNIDLTLTLDMKQAGSTYTDCYTLMDHGEYDLADGAISGNVLDPLTFMSVCCTDKLAQGFCLNWGAVTAKVNYEDPILFGKDADGNDLAWSYNALYTAGIGTAVVKEGVNIPAMEVSDTAPYSGSYEDKRGNEVEAACFPLTINQQYDEDDNPMIKFSANDDEQVIFFGDAGFAHYAGFYATGLVYDINEDDGYINVYLPHDKLNSLIKAAGDSLKRSEGMVVELVELQFQLTMTYTVGGRDTTTTYIWNVTIESVGGTTYNG